MNKVIMTLPIKPQEKTNVGILVAPTIVDSLGEIMNIDRILNINLLNTYSDREKYFYTYLNDINDSRIKYDELITDKEKLNDILIIINKMIEEKIIELSQEIIVRCECGKVEIYKEGIRDFSDGTLYKSINDNIYCSNCNSFCKEYLEDVLYIPIEKEYLNEISISPSYLKKEVAEFANNLIDSKFIVSKQRDTGCYIYVDGKKFNLDIDFIWMNLYKLFNYEEKILVACNKQFSKMFFIDYINKISKKDNLTFVGHPYISNVEGLDVNFEYYKSQNEYYKKMFILYNLGWNNKTCKWSKSKIDYLSNISDTRRKNLYDALLMSSKEINNIYLPTDENISNILQKGINFQQNISKSKKLYKQR